MANHELSRTTRLYDRREEDVSFDGIERIQIWGGRNDDVPRARHFDGHRGFGIVSGHWIEQMHGVQRVPHHPK